MNSPRFRYAFEYAAALHAADLRKGARIPYLSHLLDVCAIVMRYGGNEDTVIAALLHDAAEDHGGTARRRAEGKAGMPPALFVSLPPTIFADGLTCRLQAERAAALP